jgi:quercetin dioxygenase-like cupin family protein
MPTVLPAPIKKLPKANIPLSGVEAYISQGENHQVLFMEFTEDVHVPEHSHGAQWGVVLSGKIELTVDGRINIFAKGDQYYIPNGVIHTAKIFAGYSDISFFDEKNRYKIMT